LFHTLFQEITYYRDICVEQLFFAVVWLQISEKQLSEQRSIMGVGLKGVAKCSWILHILKNVCLSYQFLTVKDFETSKDIAI